MGPTSPLSRYRYPEFVRIMTAFRDFYRLTSLIFNRLVDTADAGCYAYRMRYLISPTILFAVAAAGQTTSAELAADCSAYASIPLPAEAEKTPVPKAPPACASYRSYRGIGRPANYSEARACAWQERLAQKADLGQNQEQPTAWTVGGSLILADIYFNGAGVKRDISLAMRFACESEEGMAKLALPDIAKLNGSRRANGPFEFCDYAASTFTMNFCSSYASEIEDERRSRYYMTATTVKRGDSGSIIDFIQNRNRMSLGAVAVYGPHSILFWLTTLSRICAVNSCFSAPRSTCM